MLHHSCDFFHQICLIRWPLTLLEMADRLGSCGWMTSNKRRGGICISSKTIKELTVFTPNSSSNTFTILLLIKKKKVFIKSGRSHKWYLKNGGLATTKNEVNDWLFTEDEFEVGDTLLDLPYLITNSLSSYRFPYHWTTKKRRSALVFPPSFDRKLATPAKAEASSPNNGEFQGGISKRERTTCFSGGRRTPAERRSTRDEQRLDFLGVVRMTNNERRLADLVVSDDEGQGRKKVEG